MNFPFTRITGGVEAVRGRKGIIFFDGVFTRKNGTRGDHIDYWNGTTYMNEATGTGAPRGGLPMFSNAEEIWFCEL